MMDAVTEDGIHTIVVMSSAQVGKSEFLLNVIGYFVDQDPAPILMLQPTLQMAEAFSKDRVAPMLRDTPALAGKVGAPRSKDSENTLLHKKFAGGHLTLCGANSPASLASRPCRIAPLADEIDRFPVSAGAEGDPVMLAMKRAATFWNRLAILTSTPTIKGGSRIEMAYEESDQRRFYVPCLGCGAEAPLQWKNLHWEKGEDGKWDQEDPWVECEDCGHRHYEQDKMAMLKAGHWMAEAFSNGVAGFHLNEMYSPWRKWREMVEDFLVAKKDTDLLRVFVNTSLGETFEEQGEGLEPTGLFARREPYAAEVPAGALVLTAGVDVQDDRLECQIRGYGMGEENWRIGYKVLWGDPAQDDVWDALDDILIRGTFKHESGSTLGVAAACIDSAGHHTTRVYEYVKRRTAKRIFACIGRDGFGRPMVSAPSRKRHGRAKRQVDLFTLGVDEIKARTYSMLRIEEQGPGFCHFPMTDEFGEEYFKQLTSEEIITKMVRGIPKRVWKVKAGHRRNESLDCSVLDYAALVLLNPNWPALEARVKGKADPEPGEDDGNEPSPRLRQRKAPRRGRGFANSWKG